MGYDVFSLLTSLFSSFTCATVHSSSEASVLFCSRRMQVLVISSSLANGGVPAVFGNASTRSLAASVLPITLRMTALLKLNFGANAGSFLDAASGDYRHKSFLSTPLSFYCKGLSKVVATTTSAVCLGVLPLLSVEVDFAFDVRIFSFPYGRPSPRCCSVCARWTPMNYSHQCGLALANF